MADQVYAPGPGGEFAWQDAPPPQAPIQQPGYILDEQGKPINPATGMPVQVNGPVVAPAVASPGNVPYAGGMAPQGAAPQPTGQATSPGAQPQADPYASAMLPGRGGGATRAAGVSPADKQWVAQQAELAQGGSEEANRQLEQQQALSQQAQDASAAALTESKTAQAKFEAEQAENKKARALLTSKAQDKQTSLDAELAQMQAQGVDPNRYWMNQSTPQKIGAAVAVALGAFGSHALGPRGSESQNQALGIINQAIGQDIDAQKTNLQARLSIMGKRLDVNAEGFNRDQAMLNAERESTQSAYTVAANSIKEQASMFAGNQEAQKQLMQLHAATIATRDAKVEKFNDMEHEANKLGERQVAIGGAAADTPQAKQFRETVLKLQEQATAAGKNPTGAELRAKAADVLGLPAPEGVSPADVSKPGVAGGGGRVARVRAELAGNNAALDIIKKHATAGFLGPSAQGDVDAAVDQLNRNGINIPTGLTARWTGKTAAQRAGAANIIAAKLKAISANPGTDSEDLSAEELGAEEQ